MTTAIRTARPAALTPGLNTEGAARIVRRALVAFALLANAVLFVFAWRGLLFAGTPPDWLGLADAAQDVLKGVNPYIDQLYAFRWSPLAAWALVPFVLGGLLLWQSLHLAALLLLPGRIAAMCLLCFAFWVDVAMANVLVFGFVLAFLALRGSRIGSIAFVVFALIVPRPLYLPILIWLWWKQPERRLDFVVVAAAMGALTVVTGLADDWMRILATSAGDVANPTNMAPSRLIGLAWLPFGIAASIWALSRGRVGLAALLASPYWLPYYFLMPLLDFATSADDRASAKSLGGFLVQKLRAIRWQGARPRRPRPAAAG